MEQDEMEGEGWPDDWFVMPWDDEGYEPDEKKIWESVTWIEDLPVPVDSFKSLR